MNTAVALTSLVLFVFAFRVAGVVPVASDAVVRVRGALSILSDKAMSEHEKERAARETSVVLFGRFLIITGLTVLAILPSALFLVTAVEFGFAGEAELIDVLVSPWLIGAAIALFGLDYLIRR